jgi:hypothetical protein
MISEEKFNFPEEKTENSLEKSTFSDVLTFVSKGFKNTVFRGNDQLFRGESQTLPVEIV